MSDQIKSSTAKVVHLNPERALAPQQPIVLTRMPAVMHSVRDKARQQLQLILKDLFEQVDDALFSRADKATNNQDQNIYFDSMREVRIRRRAIEAGFFRNLDIKFAQLFDPNAYRSADALNQDEPVTLESLSLIKNDELEELVAIEAVVNKANENFSEPIQHLSMRLDHMVPVKVYQKNNPVGPDAICDSFIEATRILDIDVKARLVVYKLFDNLMIDRLGAFIDVMNKILIDANILVSLKRESTSKRTVSTSANTAATSPSTAQGSAGYDEQTTQVLNNLRNLLGTNTGRSAPQVGGQELATGELIKLLSLAQHEQSHNGAAQNQVMNLRAMLSELLTNSAAINQVDDDVINLVSMMFEFILDDRNLAAPMKVLIGRLQIPLVKVAIADKTFFSKGGHPARRLLNEMAMACLGWQESATDEKRKDSLYEKMQETVSAIINEFESDIGIFDRLLVDFRSFLEKEKRRAQILEQRTIDAEDGKAKSEKARAQVDAELNKICNGREIPAAVNKLLREAWGNVMFITCLKQGVESQEWQNASITASQLVWSVSATMDKDNRQRLLKLVPELLQKLRTGLEGISFSPFETTQLFKQLESLHLSRLRPAPAEAAPAPAPKPDNIAEPKQAVADEQVVAPAIAKATDALVQDVSNEPVQIKPAQAEVKKVELPQENAAQASAVDADANSGQQQTLKVAVQELPVSEKLVEDNLAPAVVADKQHLALVGNITQGTWFEMMGEGGEKYRCRLAAIIRSVGKYIFVNRSGMKVAEESKESLAIALQTKRLTILDDGMLFDRALESVISTLRDKRPVS